MKRSGDSAASFLSAPPPRIWAVLLHGPDAGVAADAALTLREAWAGKGPALERTLLGDDAVRADPSALMDAVEARSLFGDARLVQLRQPGQGLVNRVVEAVEAGEQRGGFDTKLIVETGALKPTAKLLKVFAAAKHAAALEMAEDTAEDLAAHAEARLAEASVSIDADALALFAAELPGHRGLANRELDKLILYAEGLGRPLEVSDILAVSATEAERGLQGVIDALMAGDATGAVTAFDRAEAAGLNPVSLVRTLLREAARFSRARQLGAPGQRVGARLWPKVPDSQWRDFAATLSALPGTSDVRLLARLYEAESDMKSQGRISDALARQLLAQLAGAFSRPADNTKA